MKNLAIRLEEDQHAQLTLLAQLDELSVTDAIRQAIDQWIESKRSNPQLQQRAEAVLADIERDASTRRGAIAALLGHEGSEATATERTSGRNAERPSRRKGGEPATG
jgi:hypothetical protein